MATGSVTNSNADLAELVKSKWPDYLIQWRTSLWVSMREKESNVWKFVTFYGAAISLIIGIGQRLVTTLDLLVDISVGAALVGLLTFWGLAIVVDSNSWMARNLKLVGNIEKIFIPESAFEKLLPKQYSSPFFKCYRPYTVHFSLLLSLGFVAYLNFVIHFPTTGSDWRSQLLGIITLLYLFGLLVIQIFESSNRHEYLKFYEAAKGKPIGVLLEGMPTAFLSFKLDTEAKFYRWLTVAATAILTTYTVKEWRITGRSSLWIIAALTVFFGLLYLVVSAYLRQRLKRIEDDYQTPEEIDETKLLASRFFKNFSLEQTRRNYNLLVTILRFAIPVVAAFLVLILS